ncbi:hypothetical protein IKP85_06075 [bacterium]|nr:hypothetical protein [bacterium]
MNSNIKNNKLSFQAGLTPLIKKEVSSVNPTCIEQTIKRQFGTECDFQNNRTLAAGMLYALNLLREASEKFRLPFNIAPPNVNVFKTMELLKQEPVKFGFCIGEKEKVIKKHPEFEVRSIFIKNIPDNIESWNKQVEEWYAKHIVSSDNILAPFLHELLHNIHLHRIFEQSPQFGLTNAIYMANTSFSHQQNRIIADKIGTYAKTSKMELYSETLAKMIADSLDETGLKLASNPLDRLAEFPKFVREFIESQLN